MLKKIIATAMILSLCLAYSSTAFARAPKDVFIQNNSKSELLIIDGQTTLMTSKIDEKGEGYVLSGNALVEFQDNKITVNGVEAASINVNLNEPNGTIEPRFSWVWQAKIPGGLDSDYILQSSSNGNFKFNDMIINMSIGIFTAAVSLVLKVPNQAAILYGAIASFLPASPYKKSDRLYYKLDYYEHRYTPQFNRKEVYWFYYDSGYTAYTGETIIQYGYWS